MTFESKPLSSIKARQIEWLWYPYLPRGVVTLLEGDPGLGKSSLSLAIAGALATGNPALPGGGMKTAPEKTIIFAVEDDPASVLRPRLEKISLGALDHVFFNDTSLQLDSKGALYLEEEIKRVQPKLIIFDPLLAYLPGSMDINRANQVRSVMGKLAGLASLHDCAFLCIRHLRKSQSDNALYRGAGSIDFAAASRSVFMVGQSGNQKAFIHIKSNYGQLGDSQGFELGDSGFVWTGKSSLKASDVLVGPVGQQSSKLDEAKRFLMGFLEKGERSYQEIIGNAEEHEISKKTLNRAKIALGVCSERVGELGRSGGGSWFWRLPSHSFLDGQPTPPGGDGKEGYQP